LVFIGLVIIASAINIGVASVAIENSLTTDLINRIAANSQSAIGDLTNFVLIGDKAGIVNLLFNQKASHRDVAYLLLLDENNQLTASTLINESADGILGRISYLQARASR